MIADLNTAIVSHILTRLEHDLDNLTQAFHQSAERGVARHLAIDNLLPESLATAIYDAFPEKDQMRQMKSFRERKSTFKQLEQVPEILRAITFAIQDKYVLALIEKITGLSHAESDPSLYAGGLSAMTEGDFLNPHIDNSHDASGKRYRILNLLYYVTPNWQLDFGGHLELWDQKVKQAVRIPAFFNRLVLMETDPYSWHSVSPVTVQVKRCCVSNYYFSKTSPTGETYRHVTSFSARPEQTFRRGVARVDNHLRQFLRRIKKTGFGRSDTYGK